jgi:hypothetical protein
LEENYCTRPFGYTDNTFLKRKDYFFESQFFMNCQNRQITFLSIFNMVAFAGSKYKGYVFDSQPYFASKGGGWQCAWESAVELMPSF